MASPDRGCRLEIWTQVVYGRTMTDETRDSDSGAPHDGPGAGDSSQGEAGSADPANTHERVPSQEERDPTEQADTNEKADSRATVVEPGGDESSPRA